MLEAKAVVDVKTNVSESCSSDGVCALAESIVNNDSASAQTPSLTLHYTYTLMAVTQHYTLLVLISTDSTHVLSDCHQSVCVV